jgi:hypothetical protein
MNALLDFDIVDALAELLKEELGNSVTVYKHVDPTDIETSGVIVECVSAEPEQYSGSLSHGVMLNVKSAVNITIVTNYSDQNKSWEAHQSVISKVYSVIFDDEFVTALNGKIGRGAVFAADFERRENETGNRAWSHRITLMLRGLEQINTI